MADNDLSDIGFEIIDEERYKAVTSLDEVTFEVLAPTEVDASIPEGLGETALEEMVVEPVNQDVPLRDSNEEIDPDPLEEQQVEDHARRGTDEAAQTQNKASHWLSEESVALAATAINTLLQDVTTGRIPIGQIANIAFNGERVSGSVFKDFIKALNSDSRVKYIGDGDYQMMVNRKGEAIAETILSEPPIRSGQLSWLADEVISTLVQEASYPKLTPKQLLGTAKSLGVFLNDEEKHEFFVRIATDERVIAVPDGTFRLQEKKQAQDAPVVYTSKSPDGLTKKEVQEERRLEARQERATIKDRTKRVANPRRRGKNYRKKSGKRSQGRNHGKKKSFEQLLNDMNKDKG